jgi:hypothetical protein
VQQRVRVAAHRLVVVARDHQHRHVPPPDLVEDPVELPRVQHAARVPKVTEADDARIARLRFGRDAS